MKFKFYSWLLAVLTVVTFTSNASAVICNYSVAACSVDSSTSTTGSNTGCTTYGQKAFNSECIIDCSACSSGYTKVANTYRDSSGCTIDYNTCVKSASVSCTTTTATALKSGQTVISSTANCDTEVLTYRCTAAGDCVRDCGSCNIGYELTEKTVLDSNGCSLTYNGCATVLSVGECVTASDCYGAFGPIWLIIPGYTGVQSRVTYKCQVGTCVGATVYRCAPGYAGLVYETVDGGLSGTCSVCESGYYTTGGASECTACPDGSFTNATTGASSCTSCVTATGNEAATSVAPAITSESCFLPTGTQMSSDETGTKKLIENCYYESN